MNYPDDFNVPTFAAGKSIAVSRAMGVGIMAGFFIIIFLCGILIWTIRSVHVEPYIIATGGVNDEWQIVRPGGEMPEIQMTEAQVFQQSLVWNFANDWFTISPDTELNESMWDTSCRRTDCDTADGTSPCGLFCATGDDLFRRFRENVLPTYRNLADVGEFWSPVNGSIRIDPVGRVIDVGGTWRIQMIVSMNGKNVRTISYAKVAQNIKTHPKTMGYYIADFNAYRQE